MLHVARYSKTKKKRKKEKWWSNTLHRPCILLNWRVNPLLTVFDTSFSSSSSSNGAHSRTFSGSASWAKVVVHRSCLRLEGPMCPSNPTPAPGGTPRVGCPGSCPDSPWSSLRRAPRRTPKFSEIAVAISNYLQYVQKVHSETLHLFKMSLM